MSTRFTIRDLASLGLGLAFMYVGIDHFIHPAWYEPIVPEILPSARFWVLLSGFFEATLGLMLIIPRTRTIASLGMVWLLVLLYWANFNMWYNDIPLNGANYDDIWHIVRLIIQIVLIFTFTWIGEITPFKGKESKIDEMDVFKGRISSSGFASGDRIVVGDWKESPLGSFTDIMWARPDGHRTLIAPNQEVVDYVEGMYSFDEIKIQDITVTEKERRFTLSCESMELDFSWKKGWKIPFRRSLFFIATVELFFAKLFFGTRTHGTTKNTRKEWSAKARDSNITDASATIEG